MHKILQYTDVFWSEVKYCASLSWHASKKYTVIRLIVMITGVVMPYFSLALSKLLLDSLVQVNESSGAFVLSLVCLIAFLEVIQVVLSNLAQYAQELHNEMIDREIQTVLLRKNLSVDIEFFDSPDRMDAVQANYSNAAAINNIIWGIFNFLSNIISLLTAFMMLQRLSPLFSIVVCLCAIPTAYYQRKYAQKNHEWIYATACDRRQLNYISELSLSKASGYEIRLYQIGDYLLKRYQTIRLSLYASRKKLLKEKTVKICFWLMLPELCSAAMLLVITQGILNHTNTIGDYMLYSGLLVSMVSAVLGTVESAAAIYNDKLKLDSFRQFIRQPNAVQDKGKRELTYCDMIEFRNVVFGYPGTNKNILDGISFKIRQGEKVCIVGYNGTGKSTLIKLLLRFYDPVSGSVLVNGYDIKEYTLKSLRACFSAFFQQFDKYAFSLKENIVLSNLMKKPHEEELYAILDAVGARKIVESAPKGLESSLSKMFDPEGIELSIGETQKIVLARTVFRESPVVLLDEPSSALDPVAEVHFFEEMQNLFQGHTVIFTSHRLSIVHLADRIMMLENGKIIEDGCHIELMKKNGSYAKLYKIQADKYRD